MLQTRSKVDVGGRRAVLEGVLAGNFTELNTDAVYNISEPEPVHFFACGHKTLLVVCF